MLLDKKSAEDIASRTNNGYWSINNFHYFLNKRDCLLYASQLQNDPEIRYHYFDDFYSQLNHCTEPVESLDSLYRDRAQQIRDEYQYVVVAYSGGSDSDNVLNSFLDNNIKIDEIITTFPIQAIEKLSPFFSTSDKRANNTIFEYQESVVPKMLRIKKEHPNIKFTTIDYSTTSIETILKGNLHELSLGGLSATPHLRGYQMIYEYVRDIDQQKNAVLITGVDKPRIGMNPQNKKCGVWFDDFSGVFGNNKSKNLGGFLPNVEHFYYTRKMPNIWLKQSHLFKNAILSLFSQSDRPQIWDRIARLTPRGNFAFNVHHNFFKTILYKKWNPEIFQAGKPSNFFFSEQNSWFFDTDLVSDKAKEFHTKQINEFIFGISDKYIVRDKNNRPLKFVDLRTQYYTLN